MKIKHHFDFLNSTVNNEHTKPFHIVCTELVIVTHSDIAFHIESLPSISK